MLHIAISEVVILIKTVQNFSSSLRDKEIGSWELQDVDFKSVLGTD